MRMSTTLRATLTPEKSSLAAIAPGVARAVQPRSPWHSPVPYLFGGLATMLGLIAFALLILACSYWRLSRDDTQQQSNDLESGDNNKGDGVTKLNGAPIFEEKIVVIMAGNHKPTFLATPSLMLFSNNKDNSSNDHDHDHDHDGHVMVGGTNVKDDGAKESTSVQEEENDYDGNDHDGNVDGDEKAKEDESTNPHN